MSTSAFLPKLADLPTSSDASTSERRPSHLESYGVHCREPTCNLSDFLPFKCGYCKSSYCSSHRLPYAHNCSSYNEEEHDIRANLCQWCEKPLKIENLIKLGRATDIDSVMEYHISSGQCEILKQVDENGLFRDQDGARVGRNKDLSNNGNGKKKDDSKKCRYWKCNTTMWVEIKCPQCQKSFCPSHREPRIHKCGEDAKLASSSSSLNGTDTNKKTTTTTASSSSSPPIFSAPFMKSKLSSSSSSTNGTKQNNNISPSSSPNVPQKPFSRLTLSPSSSTSNKEDSNKLKNLDVVAAIKGKTTSNVNDMSASRRAAREREQAAMAFKNRAKKGLLTEEEKIRFATLQAMEAKKINPNKDNNKDCCIS